MSFRISGNETVTVLRLKLQLCGRMEMCIRRYNQISITTTTTIIIIFFTLGINDPEGFGEKIK